METRDVRAQRCAKKCVRVDMMKKKNNPYVIAEWGETRKIVKTGKRVFVDASFSRGENNNYVEQHGVPMNFFFGKNQDESD